MVAKRVFVKQDQCWAVLVLGSAHALGSARIWAVLVLLGSACIWAVRFFVGYFSEERACQGHQPHYLVAVPGLSFSHRVFRIGTSFSFKSTFGSLIILVYLVH